MRFATYGCVLLLLAVGFSASCSSQQTTPTANSQAPSSTPSVKAGVSPEFELLSAWKPAKVIVQVYSGDKFTMTAKPGTEFVAVELMMKTDDAANPVPAAMWGGTVLIDSKGNRSNLVFSYAAPLVNYQPGGDTVEYAGSEDMKPGELMGKTLKEMGGKLVVVFGAPAKDPQLKVEIAKGAQLDIPSEASDAISSRSRQSLALDFSSSSRRFSTPRMVLTISPRRLNAAIDLSQSRLSNAGIPEIIFPGGTS